MAGKRKSPGEAHAFLPAKPQLLRRTKLRVQARNICVKRARRDLARRGGAATLEATSPMWIALSLVVRVEENWQCRKLVENKHKGYPANSSERMNTDFREWSFSEQLGE